MNNICRICGEQENGWSHYQGYHPFDPIPESADEEMMKKMPIVYAVDVIREKDKEIARLRAALEKIRHGKDEDGWTLTSNEVVRIIDKALAEGTEVKGG